MDLGKGRGCSLVYKFLLFRSSGLHSFFGSFGLSGESFKKRPLKIAPPLELHRMFRGTSYNSDVKKKMNKFLLM